MKQFKVKSKENGGLTEPWNAGKILSIWNVLWERFKIVIKL